MKIKSANVLITGGASGIGKLMGRMALEKGAKALIIWDVNQEALEATAAEFSTRGRVYIYKVDITNSELVAQSHRARPDLPWHTLWFPFHPFLAGYSAIPGV